MQRPLLPHSLYLCSLLLCLFLRYDEARRSIVPRHCLVAGFIASCVCPIELARRRWCRWECMIGNCCEARTLWPFSARGTRIDVGNGREKACTSKALQGSGHRMETARKTNKITKSIGLAANSTSKFKYRWSNISHFIFVNICILCCKIGFCLLTSSLSIQTIANSFFMREKAPGNSRWTQASRRE